MSKWCQAHKIMHIQAKVFRYHAYYIPQWFLLMLSCSTCVYYIIVNTSVKFLYILTGGD